MHFYTHNLFTLFEIGCQVQRLQAPLLEFSHKETKCIKKNKTKKKALENDHPVSFSDVSDTGEKVDVNFWGQKTTTFTNIHRTFADRHEYPRWHTNKVIDQPSAKLEDAAAE